MTNQEAIEIARESLCKSVGCKGIQMYKPCHMEKECSGFKKEVAEIIVEEGESDE